MSKETLLNHCNYLEIVLTDGNSIDIKAIELAEKVIPVYCSFGKKKLRLFKTTYLYLGLYPYIYNIPKFRH